MLQQSEIDSLYLLAEQFSSRTTPKATVQDDGGTGFTVARKGKKPLVITIITDKKSAARTFADFFGYGTQDSSTWPPELKAWEKFQPSAPLPSLSKKPLIHPAPQPHPLVTEKISDPIAAITGVLHVWQGISAARTAEANAFLSHYSTNGPPSPRREDLLNAHTRVMQELQEAAGIPLKQTQIANIITIYRNASRVTRRDCLETLISQTIIKILDTDELVPVDMDALGKRANRRMKDRLRLAKTSDRPTGI